MGAEFNWIEVHSLQHLSCLSGRHYSLCTRTHPAEGKIEIKRLTKLINKSSDKNDDYYCYSYQYDTSILKGRKLQQKECVPSLKAMLKSYCRSLQPRIKKRIQTSINV